MITSKSSKRPNLKRRFWKLIYDSEALDISDFVEATSESTNVVLETSFKTFGTLPLQNHIFMNSFVSTLIIELLSYRTFQPLTRSKVLAQIIKFVNPPYNCTCIIWIRYNLQHYWPNNTLKWHNQSLWIFISVTIQFVLENASGLSSDTSPEGRTEALLLVNSLHQIRWLRLNDFGL